MKKKIQLFSICFSLLLLSVAVHAQQIDSAGLKKKGYKKEFSAQQKQEARQVMRSKWDSLSPDQKAAVQEGLKASRKHKLENMTPEQKEAMRAKMKARYDNLSPQQKEKLKQRLRDRLDALDSTKSKN